MPDLNKPGYFALKYGMPVKLDTETSCTDTAHAKTAHKTPQTAIDN
jgi:hypothetical protein